MMDSAEDDLARALKEVRVQIGRDYTEGELRAIAYRRGITISELNKQILSRGVKTALGIDLFTAEPYLAGELAMFAASNASLITRITDETMNRIEGMVWENFRQGIRPEALAAKIEEFADPEDGFPATKAALIARDQTNKLNGQLAQLRQTELGVEEYTWRTAGDERVRPEHAALNGQVFSWDEPPAEGHPGDAINCRCYAEPVLTSFLKGAEDEE